MSLLDDFARPCVLMEKTRTPDGEGGFIVDWADGIQFRNYTALETSVEARAAEKQGLTSVYSVLVDKSVPLDFHDVYRDLETGDTFRITSDPSEKQAPGSSDLNLKFYTAEKWSPSK